MSTNITFPASICHRVTRRCNVACGFCQAPNNSREQLTVSEIGALADGLAKHAVRSMKLSGGEPTIRPDIVSVVETIANNGLTPIILTNGVTLTAELVDAASLCNAEFKVSIHRSSSENDQVLRVRSFDRILRNLSRLTAARVPYSISTVIEPRRVSTIRSMTEFAIQHGARKVSFIPIVPRGRALAKPEYAFTESELDEVRRLVRQTAQEYAKDIVVRIIDFHLHDYWIIENNGDLFIERWREDLDVYLLDKTQLLDRLASPLMF